MRRTLSKNDRVIALIAALAAASFAVGGLVYVVTAGDAAKLSAAVDRLAEIRAATADLAIALDDEHGDLDDYVIAGDTRSRVRFDDASAAEVAAIAEIGKHAEALPVITDALGDVQDASRSWHDTVADPVLRAVAAGDRLALDAFRRAAVDDQEAVDAALVGLSNAIASAQADLDRQKVSNAAVQTAGVGAAFGFLLIAFSVALIAVRRFGRALEHDAKQASVLNQFTAVTSFAGDDHEIASANLIALGRLVQPDASVTHILNRSMDRAVPEASTGEAIAEVLAMHTLSRCAGVQRGTMHVTDDLADDLAVRCPIYPAASGTLACVPMSSGESVGAVHLFWARPNALPLEMRQSISRVTEHAALAIGNRRLLAALHGQANTDARTGLANSRSFDLSLESALQARTSQEPLSVLMLDVDHFKKFNDRHGHPAGDEALKAFAAVLRSCMREGDVAARYGGEEFAVYLPGIGSAAAVAIGERIRAQTEATIISLAPGLTDRITISIGIATAPDQAQDRVTLLRLADEALYQAKQGGRNRVVVVGGRERMSAGARTPAPMHALPDPRPRRQRAAADSADA